MSYLDNAASAPVRESAIQAFLEASKVVGNPDSVHSRGQAARAILDAAREDIADALHCEPVEVIFTSGGTESVNLGIRGLFGARRSNASQIPQRSIIVTSPLEHQAVLSTVQFLEQSDAAKSLELSPKAGLIDPADFDHLAGNQAADIALASFMWVNNETGAKTDVAALGKIASEYAIPLHSDGVAALGKVDIDFHSSGLAALSLCGHKVGAPVGIGALLLRRDVALAPVLLRGGEQERGLRPGTANHALAAAFAQALCEAIRQREEQQALHGDWGQRIFNTVQSVAPNAFLTISDEHRVASTLHIQLPDCDSAALVFALDLMGVSVSSGAACQAGVQGPSHVLLGMGYSNQQAERGLRISFGHATTEQDIENLLRAFPTAYEQAVAASQLS